MQLIVDLSRLLKLIFRSAVFLKLLWVGVMWCGLSRSMRGLWKLMCLAVFLKPPQVGEVRILRVAIWDCAAKLGTLNSKIPSLSDVA